MQHLDAEQTAHGLEDTMEVMILVAVVNVKHANELDITCLNCSQGSVPGL